MVRTTAGEIVLCDGGRFRRYDAAADRWDELPEPPDVAEGVVVPDDGVPPRTGSEMDVLGWLPDGTRVLMRVTYYSGMWISARDDRGDGAFEPTHPPDFFPQPTIAYPIAPDTILFAGLPSALWVAMDPIAR
jgi:hypothetical protein